VTWFEMGEGAVARPATTVILLRAGAEGLQVFMVKRHARSGFFPNAWVFPGGRVDPDDALPSDAIRLSPETAAAMGLSVEDALPWLVAGVRETFEEAGIWLGENPPTEDERRALNAGEVRFHDLLQAPGRSINLDTLRVWSHWVTPAEEKRRYDTRFLLAVVPGAEGRHDDLEVVDSGWFGAEELIEGSMRRFSLAPPTWWTLTELAALDDAASAMRVPRDIAPIQPSLKGGAGVMRIVLPARETLPGAIELSPDGYVAR